MEGDASFSNFTLTRFMAILTLESFDMPPSIVLSAFIFVVITFLLILCFHSMLLVTIFLKRNLHEPMYILLFNLSICDLMGAAGFYPQMVASIMYESRVISYPACVLQGIILHLYGTGSLLFLCIMAYDRYIAICKPLRYRSLMTRGTLSKFICMAWFINFVITGALFVLTVRHEICRTHIVDTYCNNPSLMKLTCEDTRVVNAYGLFIIALLQGFSILMVSVTYIKILITCLSPKQGKSVSKAMQTCATHLIVFLNFEVNVFLLLVSHRLESVSPHLRRAFGVAIVIIPPILNPVIYGLKYKEIRHSMLTFFQRKVSVIQ